MKLSEDQVASISKLIDKEGIRRKSLSDDVLDHLCCVVEIEMKSGKTFDDSLQQAIFDLAPHGLGQLERSTVYLLNSKKIIIMKKLIHIIGFLGAFALTGGFLFKWLHWVGADELFMGGFLVMALLFAPLYAIDMYKVSVSKGLSEKMKIISGSGAVVLIGLGWVLKLTGTYGGDFLLLGGSALFAIGFLPLLFFTMYRKSIA